MIQKTLATALVLMVILTACERHSPSTGHAFTSTDTNLTVYDVKGVLKGVSADGWKARIAHEEIPGYMEAMTMLFDVKETNELRGLLPGDAIRFRMLVTDKDGWIDRVQRIGTNTAPTDTSQSALTSSVATAWPEELEPGALVPDYVLTNQMGQTIRLSDFKGKALAFTLIFTRCPFPTFCPRLNNNLGSAQRELTETSPGTNWHLLSISFDPEYDTPSRLEKYAEGYHHDPVYWSFATGASEDIRRLGQCFGLVFMTKGGTIEHNVRTVVVDAAGRIQRIFSGNEWKSVELVEEMKRAMAIKP